MEVITKVLQKKIEAPRSTCTPNVGRYSTVEATNAFLPKYRRYCICQASVLRSGDDEAIIYCDK